jgi:uncharacterized protein (TIGR03083 family)
MPAKRVAAANLGLVWASLNSLLSGLDQSQWETPTDCPGWDVQDQVSHLIGTESVLLGLPAPAPVEAPHVRNPLGAGIEGWVAERRDRSPAEVLDEFRQVTAARSAALDAMTDEQWEAPTNSPAGQIPYGEFMQIRVMDNWVHEQDIRRAVGRPGHLEGPVAEVALGRFTRSLGYVVGKQAGAADGTSVVVRLVGPHGQVLAVTVADGRARPVEAPPDPDVVLTMTAEAYCCLSCGRWPADQARADGQVQVDGDRELGARIVSAMSIIP